MGELHHISKLPTPLTKSLTPQELDDHRMQIGVICELNCKKHDKFGWDRMDSKFRILIRKEWMDALQDYSIDEIDAARRQFTLDRPDKIPNEGHIVQKINELRRQNRPFVYDGQTGWADDDITDTQIPVFGRKSK